MEAVTVRTVEIVVNLVVLKLKIKKTVKTKQ